MDFRRNADRRRRVLRDDLSGSGRATVETKVQKIGRYDGRRTLQRQPKLIDLIPTSGWTVWPICILAILSCLTLILLNAGLPATGNRSESGKIVSSASDTSNHSDSAGTSPDQANSQGQPSVLDSAALFQLSAPGSIAGTFLTSFTLISALLCFQIYFVRRHRQDDYLGQYQIWRWLAGFFICMTVGNLPWFKPLVAQTFQTFTPDVYHSFTTKLLLGSGLFLLLGVGLRTFMEVKESVCSTFCIMTATVLSALSILLLPELETGIHQIPAIGNLPSETAFGLWFLGSVSYFCGFSLYLSYVHKDVQGKLEGNRSAKSAEDATPSGASPSVTQKTKAKAAKKTVSPSEKETPNKPKSRPVKKTVAAEEPAEEKKTPTAREVGSFGELAAALETENAGDSPSGQPAKKTRRRKKAA